MLRSHKELIGYRVHPKDEKIGKVSDFLVEDRRWEIRYMVVDTRVWLPGRKVLLSPDVLGTPDRQEGIFPVDATSESIEEGPALTEDPPVSTRRKRHLMTLGLAASPIVLAPYDAMHIHALAHGGLSAEESRPVELRSLNEVRGYEVRGRDGKAGRVVDFVVDDESWSVQFVVIDVGTMLVPELVMVSAFMIEDVRWVEQAVYVDLFKQQIEDSPGYEAGVPMSTNLDVSRHDDLVDHREAP